MLVIDTAAMRMEMHTKLVELKVRSALPHLVWDRSLVDGVGLDGCPSVLIGGRDGGLRAVTRYEYGTLDTHGAQLGDESLKIHFRSTHMMRWIPRGRLQDSDG
jgi:hypothetical protein